MTSKVVLITGGSAGIGRACAERLTTSGYSVIGASRRYEAGSSWPTLSMDVDNDDSVNNGVARVIAEHGGLDAVVTCAGWGLAGAIEQTSLDDAKAQLETNFFGTVRVVR